VNEIREASITRQVTIRQALARLDQAGSGVLLLTDEGGRFQRTVTDGDIRRLLLADGSLEDTLTKLPVRESVVLREGFTRQGALELMNQHSINHLPVIDAQGTVVRLLDRKEVDEQILLSSPHLGEHEREFVEEAFRTNWIAPLGPNVDAFERELAERVGVRDSPRAIALGRRPRRYRILLRVHLCRECKPNRLSGRRAGFHRLGA
jgi:hypothetical protein